MKKRLLKFLAVTMVLLMVLSLCSVALAKSKGKGNSSKGNSSGNSGGSTSANTKVNAYGVTVVQSPITGNWSANTKVNAYGVTAVQSPITGNWSTSSKYEEYAEQIINGGNGTRITGHGYTFDDNGNVKATISYANGDTVVIDDKHTTSIGFWSDFGGGDSGGGGGGSSYSPPPPPSVDLNVSSITPLVGYRSAVGTTLVKVHNTSTAAQSNVVVRFEVNGTTQDKTVAIAANKDRTVIFTWNTPDAASATVKVTIDPSNTISETNEGNNTLSETITLLSIPDKADPKDQPENPVPIDEVPTNVTDPDTTWTEVDETGAEKTYTASLTVTASADQSQMKSGYGFKLNVKTDISTTGKAETITKPQYVLMYVPEFRYGSAVRLESTDGINWQLPVNTESVISARRWYVPVWYPDQAYNAYILVLGANTPGGMLSASTVVPITIQGNMYEDDVTTSWAA